MAAGMAWLRRAEWLAERVDRVRAVLADVRSVTTHPWGVEAEVMP